MVLIELRKSEVIKFLSFVSITGQDLRVNDLSLQQNVLYLYRKSIPLIWHEIADSNIVIEGNTLLNAIYDTSKLNSYQLSYRLECSTLAHL